jgi:hypothetical protein
MPPAAAPSSGYPAPAAPAYPPVKKRSWRKILAIVSLVFVVLCGVGGIFVGTKIYQASQHLSFPDEGGVRWKGEDGEVAWSQPTSVDQLPDDMKPWHFAGSQMVSFVSTSDGAVSAKVLVMTTKSPLSDITAFYDERAAAMGGVSKESNGGHVRIEFDGGAVEIQESKGSNQPATIVVTIGDFGGGKAPKQ